MTGPAVVDAAVVTEPVAGADAAAGVTGPVGGAGYAALSAAFPASAAGHSARAAH